LCINSEVSIIAVGESGELGSVIKFISEMKNRPQLFGECLLFEKVRVFEEAE
jgi:hypothetical protein